MWFWALPLVRIRQPPVREQKEETMTRIQMTMLAMAGMLATSAAAADISIGTAQTTAGGSANLSVALNPSGAQVGGLQFEIDYDKSALTIVATIGAAANAA